MISTQNSLLIQTARNLKMSHSTSSIGICESANRMRNWETHTHTHTGKTWFNTIESERMTTPSLCPSSRADTMACSGLSIPLGKGKHCTASIWDLVLAPGATPPSPLCPAMLMGPRRWASLLRPGTHRTQREPSRSKWMTDPVGLILLCRTSQGLYWSLESTVASGVLPLSLSGHFHPGWQPRWNLGKTCSSAFHVFTSFTGPSNPA